MQQKRTFSYRAHCRHPFGKRNAVIDDNNDLMTKFPLTQCFILATEFVEVRPHAQIRSAFLEFWENCLMIFYEILKTILFKISHNTWTKTGSHISNTCLYLHVWNVCMWICIRVNRWITRYLFNHLGLNAAEIQWPIFIKRIVWQQLFFSRQ